MLKKLLLSLLIMGTLLNATEFYTTKVNPNCIVKGNISYNSGTKYYFLSSHRDYLGVRINRSGERCFKIEEEAKKSRLD